MTPVEERMYKAVGANFGGATVADVSMIVKACARVALEDNAKLLDMLKARGAEVEAATSKAIESLGYRPTFAAIAMQAILSRDDWGTNDNEALVARSAVKYADALIAMLGAVKP